ncbi:MAG TPA: hypothetical protein VFM74_01760, partial [Candidatus Limnocylindria bacterium]|nr:hypothetical protein [Candidatus Limnocylindria bacterium]
EADVPFDLLPEEVYLESADEPVVAEADAPETEPTVAAIEFEPPVVAEAEPVAVEAQPEPMVAAELEAEPVVAEAQPEPELVADVETEPEIAEAPEPDLVTNVEPGPEPAAAVEPEPELTAEAEPELEPVPEAELVSNAEPEPKPEVRRATLRPIADTIMRLPAPPPVVDEPRVAAEADDPAVAARRAQLDLLGLGDPGEGPVAPAPRTVLPYRSSGASAPLPSRQAAAGATAGGSFWDASAREVAGALSQIGVQNCGQCGLSLSASARFCRRCGTRQARSA